MSHAIGDRDVAYSTCESCGTEASQPFSTNGAVGSADHNWSIYVCGGAGKGSANDGCGRNWSVTTARGLAHNAAVGTRTLGRVTPDVASSRFISAPSEAYRANFERIFGHG